MQIDPMQEWLRLTKEYRAKGDVELLEIYRDFADLTDVAQRVLAAELRSRGLDKKIAEEKEAAAKVDRFASSQPPLPILERAEEAVQSRVLGNNATEPVPDEKEVAENEDDAPVEYTWKTALCECEEREQAYQIREVLRRAGIESWIQPRYGILYTRVLVAADELDRAQAIIANPIPQDIVDESHATVPEFESPRCPSCGEQDPTLESTEPVNAWKCESCGREWTDPAGQPEQVAS